MIQIEDEEQTPETGDHMTRATMLLDLMLVAVWNSNIIRYYLLNINF